MWENLMSHSVQFGSGTAQNVSWAEMVNRWKSIEDLGFDSVWIPDQFLKKEGSLLIITVTIRCVQEYIQPLLYLLLMS